MLQLLDPVRLAHGGSEQPCIRAVDAEAVVDHARPVVLQHSAEEPHLTAYCPEIEIVRARLRGLDLEEAGAHLRAARRDGLSVAVINIDAELAARRLLQIVNIHAREVLARLALARRAEARVLAWPRRAKRHAAQPELAVVPLPVHHRVGAPTSAGREADRVVPVPGPGPVDQDEAVARVAEARLHQATN